MAVPFDLQGHRGARGLKPENTLPSFEAALDVGVTSVETDVHLSGDGVPVLIHDPWISARLFRPLVRAGELEPGRRLSIRTLSRDELRAYAADRNPDPARFPTQDTEVPPLAAAFAARRGAHPFAPPSLDDLLAFIKEYVGEMGRVVGKTELQQQRTRRVRLDLELKRVPFRPEVMGDSFDGTAAGLLEARVVEIIRAAGWVAQTSVRSFDHRSVRAVRQLEPGLSGAVLLPGTAPVSPGRVAADAGATVYCPQFEFLDETIVRRAHAEGVRVVPWTVNDPDDWARLLEWSVDGITTDYPDRLAEMLQGVEITPYGLAQDRGPAQEPEPVGE